MDKFVDKLKLVWSKTNRWHRVFFVFVVAQLKFIPGSKYGFYCNDPALSHPFTGDTIHWKWLIGVTVLLPLAIMLLIERTYHTEDKHRSRRRALRWYKEYIFGFLFNLALVSVLKQLVGSPRPHFFDTCKPEEALTCKESEFVSRYKCTKAPWEYQSDTSFPSGHASLAVHAGLFIAYYLQSRTSPHCHTIRAAQGLSVASAVYCAVSRMTDHRHHWWDVLAGTAIGVGILAYTILSLCRNFQCKNKSSDVFTKPTNEETNNHSKKADTNIETSHITT